MEAIVLPSLVNLKAVSLAYFTLGFALILFYLAAGGVAFGRTILRPSSFFPVPGIGLLLIVALTLWALAFRTVAAIVWSLKVPLFLGIIFSAIFAFAAWKKRQGIMQVLALFLLAWQGYLLMGVLSSFHLINGVLAFDFLAWPNVMGLLLWPIMMISGAALPQNSFSDKAVPVFEENKLSVFWVKHAIWLWPISLGMLALTVAVALRALGFSWWPFVWWGLMFAHAILAIAKRHQTFIKEVYTSISLGLLGGLSLIFPQVIWPHARGRLWWEDLLWPRPWMLEGLIPMAVTVVLAWCWYHRWEKTVG